MTIEEIVHDWLIENEYDGLYNDNVGCACDLAGLMDCYEPTRDCSPGVKKSDPTGEHEFLIVEKPERLCGTCHYHDGARCSVGTSGSGECSTRRSSLSLACDLWREPKKFCTECGHWKDGACSVWEKAGLTMNEPAIGMACARWDPK
jgi:hypothetical protein